MATTGGHDNIHYAQREERATRDIVAGGSITAAVCGIGAIVLSIIGLTGIAPQLLAAISTIAIGVALLIEGGSIAARVTHMVGEQGSHREREEVGGRMAVESLAGIAGIVLGILALLDIVPLTLLASAAIVFGGGLLLESAAQSRINDIVRRWSYEHEEGRHVAGEAVAAASGSDVLIGLGSIVLGILALIGFNPLTLVLVALLCCGCAVLFSGSALAGKVMSAFGR